MNYPKHYYGWRISFNPFLPATGQWRAEKHGVGMCADSRDALYTMIEQRFKDETLIVR